MNSIVMATYNGGGFIHAQIESILRQITIHDELIIVDDGSSDNTISIIKSFNDPRINLVINKKNIGVVGNFYRGLLLAKGDYIFLSDQDDIWAENKVSSVLRLLESYDMVCHDCTVTNSKLEMIHPSYFELRKSGKGVIKNFIRNGYIGCCMAFKKDVFLASQDEFLNVPMHDVWLGLIAELNGFKVHFSDEKLIKYRRHEQAVSETGRKNQIIPSFKAIRERWRLLNSLRQNGSLI
ncbi:MAG: glycosyltransferase involved in cell wall biosynthesis [Bermanella sp.]|jgi:glycosyltransferase involved in cell wall biosynthesis